MGYFKDLKKLAIDADQEENNGIFDVDAAIVDRDEELRQQELDVQQRSGEGVTGLLGDVGRGVVGGVVRGAEMISKAGEFVLPGDATDVGSLASGAAETADWLKGIREDKPGVFGESRLSEESRTESAWDPRGWLHGGMESLGMLVPAAATGTGIVGIGTQFWGGTAQEAYDEAVENERRGIGEKLTEEEKLVYANLRGFWEGGLEAVQSKIPFKIAKMLPKSAQQNIIRAAVKRPGSAILNVTKDMAKTVAAEVPMELAQEFLGQKTAYEYGQSETDPGWDEIKAVVGPTIIMSAVLGFAGQASASNERKQLHDALTKPDVDPASRIAAVQAVHQRIKADDPELAQMWLEQTAPLLEKGLPVALPLDEEVRQQAAEGPPQTGVEKLKEALEIENAELKARTAAREEGAVQPVETPEGVVEPVLEEAPETIENLDQRIDRLETTIESRPDHPHIERFKEGLVKVKAQRKALLDEQEGVTPVEPEIVAPEVAQAPEAAETEIDAAAHEAQASPQNDLPEPSEAQIEAGNYKKGHVSVQGLDVSIENPAGSTRSGTNEQGEGWSRKMNNHYGYIKRTEGADGDQVDVFLGPAPENADRPVFVVNQKNPTTGEFDEHKVMMGFETEAEAREAYLSEYEEGWQGLDSIQSFDTDGFKTWLKDGDQKVEAPPVEVSGLTEKEYNELDPLLQQGVDQIRESKKAEPVAKERAPEVEPEAPTTRDEAINKSPVKRGWRRQAFTLPISGYEKYVFVRDTRVKDGKAVTQIIGEDGKVRNASPTMLERLDRAVKAGETVPYEVTAPTAAPEPVAEESTIVEEVSGKGVQKEAATVQVETTLEETRRFEKTLEGVLGVGEGAVNLKLFGTPVVISIDTAKILNKEFLRIKKAELKKNPEAGESEADRVAKEKTFSMLHRMLSSQVDKQTDKKEPIAEAPEAAPPKAPKKKVTEPAEKIEDFGEVLEGAKKHYADKLSDAMKLDIATYPLSKTWPEPDYQQMIKDGVDPYIVAMVRSMREQVPTKGRSGWKVKRYVESVDMLRGFSQQLVAGEINKKTFTDALDGSEYKFLKKMLTGQVDLYLAVGHENSLKGISLQVGSYGYFDGVKYSPPKTIWTVERKAKATAFSNWPTTLIQGNTREEALAEFKKKASSLLSVRETKFVVYSKSNSNKVFVGKKVGKNYIELESFDDLKVAREYLNNNHDALVAKLKKIKDIPSERKETNSPRVGEDHRGGQDVTPEMFTEAFGFRGVQFGNYVEGSKRQQDLNEAYDALMDLAGILGIPSQAISLHGELGLAFGARGSGGKGAPKAHYEPGSIVINLTKRAGAGSLAHEWWHAADNYFGRSHKDAGTMMTERLRGREVGGEVRREVRDAYDVIKAAIDKTDLQKRSNVLDRTRSKPYWGTRVEMTARAFETYIIDKLNDNNGSNDYLANIVSQEYWDAATKLGIEQDNSYPYLTAEERLDVREAYQNFFDIVETKQTDKGVLLYSTAKETQTLADTAKDLGEKLKLAKGDSAQAKAVIELGKRFNKKIVFFEGTKKVNGFFNTAHPDTLFINTNNPDMALFTFGHELLHSLKQENPDLYVDMFKVLFNHVNDFDTFFDEFNANRVKKGMSQLDAVGVAEEFFADFSGEQFTDKAFWEKLLKQDKNLFDKIVELFQKLFAQIDDTTSEHFRGLNKAQDALASVLNEYADQAGGKKGSKKAETKLSLTSPTKSGKIDITGSETKLTDETKIGALQDLIPLFKKTGFTPVEIAAVANQVATRDQMIMDAGFDPVTMVNNEDGQVTVTTVVSKDGKEVLKLSREYRNFGEGMEHMLALIVNVSGESTNLTRKIYQSESETAKRFGIRTWGTFANDYTAKLFNEYYENVEPGIGEGSLESIPKKTKRSLTAEGTTYLTEAMRGQDDNTRTGYDRSKHQVISRSFDFKGKPSVETSIGVDARKIQRGRKSESVKFSTAKQSPIGFYSGLSEAMNTSIFDQKTLTGAQVAKKLQKAVASGKAKQEEVDAVGLVDYLKLREKDTLTKEEVTEFIDQNGVQVEEVTLGKPFKVMDAISKELGYGGWHASLSEDQKAEVVEAFEAQDRGDGPSKYGDYTLPGGTNYREVLLTLPEGGLYTEEDLDYVGIRSMGGIDYHEIKVPGNLLALPVSKYPTKKDAIAHALTKKNDQKDQGFKSSHFDQPNILAHMRVNDREVNGEKVLFIEEIQSDWNIAGRKSGFVEKQPKYTLDNLPEGVSFETLEDGRIRLLFPNNLKEVVPTKTVAEESLNLYVENRDFGGITPAPFVTTSAWQNLVLKRALRIAAEGGYDRVAWVNGEQTAERYSLDKQVDEILYHKNDKGLYTISAEKDGNVKSANENLTETDLENMLGKEIAKRIIDDIGKPVKNEDEGVKSISGDDLKIEATWARNLYDRAIPAAMRKLTKQKVEPVTVNKGEEQLSVSVTPELRSTVVEKGQTLFSTAPPTDSKAFKKWFGDSKVVDEAGDPLVVYHGTQASDVKSFRVAANDLGIHFGTRDQANDRLKFISQRANEGRINLKGGENIVPVYLSMKNPLILESDPGSWDWHNLPYVLAGTEVDIEEMAQRYSEEGYDAEDDPDFAEERFDELISEFTQHAVNEIKDAGYDGIQYLNTGEIKGMAEVMERFNTAKTSQEKSTLMDEKNVLEASVVAGDINSYSYIAFEPEQIKSATGNIGTYDPKNPDIRYSSKTPDDVIKEVFQNDEEAAETLTGRVTVAMDTVFNKELRKDKLDRMRTYMVDKYGPINKELGSTVYKLHRMLNNSAATLSTFLQHGKMSWKDGAITINTKDEGFVPWLQSLGEEGHKFMYWVAAKRAEKLSEEDRENWFKKEQRDVIIEDAEARGMNQQYHKWNQELQRFNRNVVDIATEAGLIDPEARKNWMSDFYLPFYRVLENEETAEEFIKGPTSSKKYITSGVKTLKGGEATLGDPLHNLIQNWTHLITESQRQMARQSAGELMLDLNMAEEMSAGQLVKILGVNSVYGVKGLTPDGNTSWKEFEGMTRAEVMKVVDATPGASLIEKQVIRSANKEEARVMSFMRNGKPVYLKVDDMDLYEALTQINSKALDNGIVTGASWFKRMLTLGATFGAGFRIANFLRDTIHTGVVSKSFMPMIDSMKGVVKVWRKSPEYIELMASGGGFSQGYLNSADPAALSRTIKKIINSEGLSGEKRILDTPRRLLDFWERIGHASEMAARVQLYTNLKEGPAKKSHLEAAFEARDLLDFALTGKGEAVRVLTAVTPFMNARMQGLDRLARGAIADPRGFLIKGGIVTAASLALWAAYRDDDRYKELEDFDKWQYHHFWIGEEHYRIPKAFEVGAIFSTMWEAAADTAFGDEDMEYFFDMLAHTFTSTFAIGTPTVVTPMMELWANKSFFTGRDLEPEWMQNLSQGARANPWTSTSLKEIGKATNISPVKLQTLIRGYTATIGTGLLATADTMLEFREDVVSPQKYAHEIVGLDRFIKSQTGGTKYATRYHEFAQEAVQTFNTINNYQRTGDFDTAREMAEDQPDYKSRKKFVESVNKRLASVRRQEKVIWSDLNMTRELKRSRLEQLRTKKNEIYKAAYEMVRNQKR